MENSGIASFQYSAHHSVKKFRFNLRFCMRKKIKIIALLAQFACKKDVLYCWDSREFAVSTVAHIFLPEFYCEHNFISHEGLEGRLRPFFLVLNVISSSLGNNTRYEDLTAPLSYGPQLPLGTHCAVSASTRRDPFKMAHRRWCAQRSLPQLLACLNSHLLDAPDVYAPMHPAHSLHAGTVLYKLI